jgi:hypothetical protein
VPVPIIPWPDRIRNRGQLKLFAKPSFTASVWATDLDPAIAIMNRCLKGHGIWLVYIRVDDVNSADVTAETIPGYGMHGQNDLVPQKINGKVQMDWAHLKLPATPSVDGKKGGTILGPPGRQAILVHELIHGVGIDAHSAAGVFVAQTIITIGTKPDGTQQPADGSDSIPPIRFDDQTVLFLKDAWPTQPPASQPTTP